MSVINFSAITTALKTLIAAGSTGYTIERNSVRNDDPNVAAIGKGWIGVRKGMIDYKAHTTGSSPWLAEIEVIAEVQYAHMSDPETAETQIETAIAEILGIINSNLTIGNTVSHVKGFRVDYFDVPDARNTYWYGGVITIRAEARA